MRAHYISIKPKSKRIRVYRALVYANIVLFLANILFYKSLAGPEILLSQAASINSTLEILALTPSAETPTPTPTPGVPGLAFPGLVLAPITEERIFLEREQGIEPYVVVTQVSGVDVRPGEVLRTFSREPKILGKTNLQSAYIFIEIFGFEKKIYTVFADARGTWTWYFPFVLEPGLHTFTLTAISSVNPYFQAKNTFRFEVVPIPKEIPTPFLPPKIIQPEVLEKIITEKVSPVIPTHITPGKDLFSLDVRVSPLTKEVFPRESVHIKTDIRRVSSIKFGEEIVDIRFIVLNPRGEKVLEKTESILIKDSITIEKRLLTSYGTDAGEYRVLFEISRGSVTYIGADSFVVKERVLLDLPGAITITSKTVSDALFRLSFVFILLVVIFLSLLFWEYEVSRRERKIDEDDLYRDRDIL